MAIGGAPIPVSVPITPLTPPATKREPVEMGNVSPKTVKPTYSSLVLSP